MRQAPSSLTRLTCGERVITLGHLANWELPGPACAAAAEPHANGLLRFRVPHSDSVTQRFVAGTRVLETHVKTSTGAAHWFDFFPCRHGVNAPGDRFVRLLEGLEGTVSIGVNWDASALDTTGGCVRALAEDDVRVLANNDASGEMSVVLHQGETLAWQLDYGCTHAVAHSLTNAQWDLDQTFDAWLEWANRCRFDGPQRRFVVELAAPLAAQVSATGIAGGACRHGERDSTHAWQALGMMALEAWGFAPESEWAWLNLSGEGGWLLVALSQGLAAGLLDAYPLYTRWPTIQAWVSGWLGRAERPAHVVNGILAASAIADAWNLDGDHAEWRRQVAPDTADAIPQFFIAAQDDTGWDAVRAVQRQLDVGGYQQARRAMDAWLLESRVDGTPWHSLALWLAARIYLAPPGKPEPVETGEPWSDFELNRAE